MRNPIKPISSGRLDFRSILIILMCIELMLLSLNLNFITFSIYFDDLFGQIFSFFILTVAASESAVGLAIIIIYYRVRGNISIRCLTPIHFIDFIDF